MIQEFKSLDPAKFYRDYFNQGVRPDGRDLTSFRPVLINVDSIATSDGSAVARVGRTTVVCGIKAEFAVPKPERPHEGFLVPNVELLPLCSPKFRPGPPSDEAQLTTKLLANIMESSQCIELKDLCIAKDKLAWCLYADLICLDYDGSLLDACLLALVAALKNVTLPAVDYDPAIDNKLVNDEERNHLKVYNCPTSTTYGIFENVILTDPCGEEESLCTDQVTIVTKENEIVFIHKHGSTSVPDHHIQTCIDMSKSRSQSLRSLISTALEENNG